MKEDPVPVTKKYIFINGKKRLVKISCSAEMKNGHGKLTGYGKNETEAIQRLKDWFKKNK